MQPISFPEPLVADVERRYGLRVSALEPLAGGYECDVALLTTVGGERRVLRVSPAARSVQELAWAYDLAGYASLHIPQAVAPLAARDRSRVFTHARRPVSLFPFVDGHLLDREDAAERNAAARLLGRLHRVLPGWPAARPRPDPPSHRPTAPHVASEAELAEQGATLPDAALDRFIAGWRAGSRLPPAPLHGDFYRGNLLCMDGEVVGLLDWDDALFGSREYELAWTVWELAQAPEPAVTLDSARAMRFLEAYAETGPVDVAERGWVVPLIRAHLRFEVWRAAIEEGQGMQVDHEYIARNVAAFDALRTQRL
jgi:Ser/Thr protein kinase RdoA (MazF antagonist)